MIMKTLDAGASRHGSTVVKPVLFFKFSRESLKYFFAVLMLLIAALFWGLGNVAQKIALADTSPMMLLFLRSSIALLFLSPLAVWEWRARRITLKAMWRHKLLLAITVASFAMGLALQTYGGQITSATNLGFLINLCVLITPLFLYVGFNEKISRFTLLSCFICFTGAVMLTGFNLQAPNVGDALCLAGAVFYAVWIIALDRTLKVIDAPILITTLQFVPASLAGLFVATPQGEVFSVNFTAIWPALLFVSILSTCVSFLIASYAQRLVKPVVAALIYSFEALFGFVAAYFALGEQLSAIAMLGGGLMFVSVICCQYIANANQAKIQKSQDSRRTFRRSTKQAEI
jgi:drug/metabolite transporter (DMT)-like permease